MRTHLLALTAVSVILAGASAPSLASAADGRMAACAAQWQAMKKAGTATGKYTDFSKTCMKSAAAPASPAAAKAPAAPAPAKVAAAETKAPAPAPAAAPAAKKPSALGALLAKAAATPAPAAPPAKAKVTKAKGSTEAKADNSDPTGATGQCKDGSYTHAQNHAGACSGHGGVAKWL